MYGEMGEMSNSMVIGGRTGCIRGLSLRSTWAESEWIAIGCGPVVSQASRALFIFICLHNTCLPSSRKALPHLQTLEAQ